MTRPFKLATSCLTLGLLLGGCASQDHLPGGNQASELIECNDGLYVPAHLPEECIPREPVEPAKSPKRDPIIGTYRLFTTKSDGHHNSKHSQYVFRVFPNKKAGADGWNDYFRWEREGEVYKFYTRGNGPDGLTAYKYLEATLKYQSVAGEPHLIVLEHRPYRFWPSEGIKVSSDPSHKFDFYKVICHYNSKKKCHLYKRDVDGEYVRGGPSGHSLLEDPQPGWTCKNVGRESYLGYQGRLRVNFLYGDAPDWGDTLAECESRCEKALLNHFETVGEGNCSDYLPR